MSFRTNNDVQYIIGKGLYFENNTQFNYEHPKRTNAKKYNVYYFGIRMKF